VQLISRDSRIARRPRDCSSPEATVKKHLLHYAKLDVSDRAAAVATAFERGLLGPRRR
jgi:DNA-binding NarL/FixJ family response regulator